MNRRNFLKLSGVSAVALAGIGAISAASRWSKPEGAWKVLNTHHQAFWRAVLPVVLDDSLPSDDDTLEKLIKTLDEAIFQIGPFQSNQLIDLLNLLTWAPTRFSLAGVSGEWSEQSKEEINGFLTGWRNSSVSLFNAGYNGITKLSVAVWFGQPASFNAANYPGPPETISNLIDTSWLNR